MNGIIEESTIERMEEIRGKPIRRGLDKAINECLDKLETEDVDEGTETIEKSTEPEVNCLSKSTKRCLN